MARKRKKAYASWWDWVRGGRFTQKQTLSRVKSVLSKAHKQINKES